MKPLLQQPPARPSESGDERVRLLEERVERLTRELAAMRTPARESSFDSETSEPGSADGVDAAERGAVGRARSRLRRGMLRSSRLSADKRRRFIPSVPIVRRLELEAWLGYYGALALASLTILLGVGAFLSWAIMSGQLEPVA
jgi:hypothetical protein